MKRNPSALVMMAFIASFTSSCAQKPVAATPLHRPTSNVGDIPFDPSVDDSSFRVCDTSRMFQYYNTDSWFLDHKDSIRNYLMNGFQPSSHELHVVMALCERALGNRDAMLAYFARGIDSTVGQQGFAAVGFYDYLHLGAALLDQQDYAGAIAALQLENKKYDKFADTWYYLGEAYAHTGQNHLSIESLQRAKALFSDATSKYFVYDIYCEMPDQVYPPQVDSALSALQASALHATTAHDHDTPAPVHTRATTARARSAT